MASVELHRAHSPEDAFPRLIPPQLQNHAQQNVLPAANNTQFMGYWENVYPHVRDIAMPGRLQDPHHINVAHNARHDVVDYHPLAREDLVVQHMAPNPGLAQGHGFPAPAQPNPAENQENAHFGYLPEHAVHGPAHAVFLNPFGHRNPAPGEPAAEHLRRLASRCLHHPGSQIETFCMEPDAIGHCKVVIILDIADILAVITGDNQM